MKVQVCDVGPRDGLQNEAAVLEPGVRAELCDRIAASGVARIEAASFVNPKLVPQMAGAEEVFASLGRAEGVVYSGLVLNERGYDRALAAGVDEIHYGFAVTDSFGLRNQNQTTEQGLELCHRLVGRARADGVPITWPFESISCISSDEVRFAGWPLTVARSKAGVVRFGSAAKPAFVPMIKGVSSIHSAVAWLEP